MSWPEDLYRGIPLRPRPESMADIEERYRRLGTGDWKRHGSASEHHRYAESVDSRSPGHCGCGCKRRATHRGMANGVCLIMGCELRVARWVRNGS